MSDPESINLEPGHPGHLLPAEEWAEVVRQATAEAERIDAGHLRTIAPPAEGELAEGSLSEPGRFGTGVGITLSGTVVAPSNGGRRPGGAPTFGVFHSAETPLANGYAASIARYFGRGPGTSCHYMIDPAETWGVLPDEFIAWHVGNGNTNSLGLEHAGYARLTREEWTSPAGLALVSRSAAVVAGARARYGIEPRMMSDDELLRAHRRQTVGGWATHDQCRRVLGGTTHTDPGAGFALDLILAAAGGMPPASPLPTPSVPALPGRPDWTLPAGHYLGNIAGPAASHGGINAAERALVLYAQRVFIARGCVPGVVDWRSGWADGKWEGATDDACRRWFARYRPGQPFTTRLYRDDWGALG